MQLEYILSSDNDTPHTQDCLSVIVPVTPLLKKYLSNLGRPCAIYKLVNVIITICLLICWWKSYETCCWGLSAVTTDLEIDIMKLCLHLVHPILVVRIIYDLFSEFIDVEPEKYICIIEPPSVMRDRQIYQLSHNRILSKFFYDIRMLQKTIAIVVLLTIFLTKSKIYHVCTIIVAFLIYIYNSFQLNGRINRLKTSVLNQTLIAQNNISFIAGKIFIHEQPALNYPIKLDIEHAYQYQWV